MAHQAAIPTSRSRLWARFFRDELKWTEGRLESKMHGRVAANERSFLGQLQQHGLPADPDTGTEPWLFYWQYNSKGIQIHSLETRNRVTDKKLKEHKTPLSAYRTNFVHIIATPARIGFAVSSVLKGGVVFARVIEYEDMEDILLGFNGNDGYISFIPTEGDVVHVNWRPQGIGPFKALGLLFVALNDSASIQSAVDAKIINADWDRRLRKAASREAQLAGTLAAFADEIMAVTGKRAQSLGI